MDRKLRFVRSAMLLIPLAGLAGVPNLGSAAPPATPKGRKAPDKPARDSGKPPALKPRRLPPAVLLSLPKGASVIRSGKTLKDAKKGMTLRQGDVLKVKSGNVD